MASKLSLRQRNRLHTMQLVQATAIELFDADGFEHTTIDSIAEVCAVSPSTIYRHFATKEHIVLWDDRDPIIDDELARRLRQQPVVDAFRDAAITVLADRPDGELFLRRLKLIYAEASIWAAAATQDRVDRAELAAGIAAARGHKLATLADDCTAAICLAALDIALDRWQQAAADTSLADLIVEAFSATTALGSAEADSR